MKKMICVLVLGGAFLAPEVLAWGTDGHRAVGAIADQLILGSPAERRVAALLLPGESLESVANWADCAKGPYCGPQTAEMTAFTTANPHHGQYHYTDIPFQNAHYRDGEVGSAPDDIVQTLKQCIAVLQGRDDPASNPHRFSQREALVLLAHLVGDIHQPLHVGAAYVGKDGGFVAPTSAAQIDAVTVFDARGGNNLLLDEPTLSAAGERLIPAAAAQEGEGAAKAADAAPKPATRPFHFYWDMTVVDYAMRRAGASTPAQFARKVIGARPAVAANTGAPIGWPYQWADEALVAAKLAYADVTPGPIAQQTGKKGESYNVWALTVPPNYPVPSSALAREQLTEGGYHLAALLRAIWP